MPWQCTGSIDPYALVDARLQLHWAAQAAAGVGRTLNPPRPDDSHTNFAWSDEEEALLQEPVQGLVAGLRLRDLTLLVRGGTHAELPLRGRTLDEGFAFLESHFGAALRRPDVELPDHPVAHGAPFNAQDAQLAELARYYANAASAFEGPVRCWPHHFDIATLIDLGDSRTIGIGLSPGDRTFSEPYIYVTPWPYPDASRLGALSAGRWNTVGWTGAVLLASEMKNEGTVCGFVAEAMERAREALGAL
jgi:hypothetical protein